MAYHLTFIAVSYCEEAYPHHDFVDTNGKAFNMIIPLEIVKEANPELIVQSSCSRYDGEYKYTYGKAIMLGDNAIHATAACDYTSTGEMRMAATIYLADMNEDNLDGIIKEFTQYYPPKDRQFLLKQKGMHWKKNQTDSNKVQNSIKIV